MDSGETQGRHGKAPGEHEEIATERLRLHEGTIEVLRSDLAGRAALATELGAVVTPEWPPQMYPPEKVERRIRELSDPSQRGWWSWYAVERDTSTLVGMATFLGKPVDGEVEVGYAICRSAQRRGLASEALAALIDRAWAHPAVERIVAITTPENIGSIAVLLKAGFSPLAKSPEGEAHFRLRRQS